MCTFSREPINSPGTESFWICLDVILLELAWSMPTLPQPDTWQTVTQLIAIAIALEVLCCAGSWGVGGTPGSTY